MLDNLKAALDATGYPFAHHAWRKGSPELRGDFGIYAEDGENALFAGNHHAERAITGTVDFFSHDASGAAMATIESALDSVELLAWYVYLIQYEDDTGYLHYTWRFEYLG